MRYLISLTCATGTVILLMVAMSRLVTAQPMEPGTIVEVPDYQSVTVDDEVIRKLYQARQKESEPKQVEDVQPVKCPENKTRNKPSEVAVLSNSGFSLPSIGTEGLDITGDFAMSFTGTPGQQMPITRIEPVYPTEARLKNLEGFVTLEFQVNVLGDVTGIEVIESSPKRIFDKAAINAVRKWKFPQSSDKSHEVQQVTLEFKMES